MDAYKNFAYSTVATAPSPASSGTSLVVAAADGGKFPAVPFNAVIWPAGAQPLTSNAEIVRVTNRATDTLTITRTQESTSARTVVVGDQIMAAWTSKLATDITADIAVAANWSWRLVADGGALGADGATLADFTSIPGTYNHLMIILQARGDNAAAQFGWLRFNNDSAANYDYTGTGGLNATSSTASSNAQTQGTCAVIPGTGYTAGQAGTARLWLPFYKETNWRKTWTSQAANPDQTAANMYDFQYSGSWRNTAAVTRITIGIGAGNYKAGSHAMLYGII